MNKSDVMGLLALGSLLGPSWPDAGGYGSTERKYRLRNKTAHGVTRKAKNKAARASRKRNRQNS